MDLAQPHNGSLALIDGQKVSEDEKKSFHAGDS